jgi:hypothetical protein
MMSSFAKNDASVMNIKIGNIEPGETVKIQYSLIG